MDIKIFEERKRSKEKTEKDTEKQVINSKLSYKWLEHMITYSANTALLLPVMTVIIDLIANISVIIGFCV